jgi:hypothetical protein
LRLVRGVAAPSADEGPAAVSARDPGALVCSPALAVAFASVDLIPLGTHRFALGRVEKNHVSEVYWPGRDVVFHEHADRIVGYEVPYDAQVVERARKYRWGVADPPPRTEPVPEDLRDAIGGTYESGSYGTVDVHAYPEFIELAFGSEVDTLRYQGAGYFVSNRRDVVTFVRDPTTQRWTLRVFESAGYAYEFEKPDAFEAP